MAAYIPLPGFIAQGWGRRPRRRRSTAPISINWAAIEAAPANGMAMIDTVTLQATEIVDMVQCVKWDNPIGAAVWLLTDSGDIIKLPPYSNGVQPLLVGQGDKVTAQLDPAYGPPPASWPNTTLTFMSVAAEQAVYTVGSNFNAFPVAGGNPSVNGYFDDSVTGYRATLNFQGLVLTNAPVTAFLLPDNAAGLSTVGSIAITGYDISLVCTGIAATENLDLIVDYSAGVVFQGTLRQSASFPAGTPAPAFTLSRKGVSFVGQLALATNPAIRLALSAAPGGTVTATGGIDVILFP